MAEEDPKVTADDGEWYDEVVDEVAEDEGRFGGFAVRRPTMTGRDRVEGAEWGRYFEKSSSKDFKSKKQEIESGWGAKDATFAISSLFAGFKTLTMGLSAILNTLPALGLAAVLLVGAPYAAESVSGGGGLAIQFLLALLALVVTLIGLLQVIIFSVNQGMHERSVRSEDDGVIELLSWGKSLSAACMLFVEILLTLVIVWSVTAIGLFLLAGGMFGLPLPAVDTTHLSAGMLLYLLGVITSIIAMVGILPYAIRRSVELS